MRTSAWVPHEVATARVPERVMEDSAGRSARGFPMNFDFQIFTNSVSNRMWFCDERGGPPSTARVTRRCTWISFFGRDGDCTVPRTPCSHRVRDRPVDFHSELQGVFRTYNTRETGSRGGGRSLELQADFAMRACGCTGLLPPILRRASPYLRPRRLARSWVPSGDRSHLATTADEVRGRQNSESWTHHGSARQHATWLRTGLDSGAALRRATRGMFPRV